MPVCGWKYPERAHVRLSFDHALSLPSVQRCEVCWASSYTNNDTNSSGSETSSGTSDKDQSSSSDSGTRDTGSCGEVVAE